MNTEIRLLVKAVGSDLDKWIPHQLKLNITNCYNSLGKKEMQHLYSRTEAHFELF